MKLRNVILQHLHELTDVLRNKPEKLLSVPQKFSPSLHLTSENTTFEKSTPRAWAYLQHGGKTVDFKNNCLC